MKQLMILLLLLPFFVAAQGINFEQNLTWEQIKAKAKAENKFIFIDCFATWCGPCKMMDKNVYPKDSVGDIINKSFVSVKVQCDTSKNDQDGIKAWYADAHQIIMEYRISAFPTFLFLSPDGKVVHKGLGFHKPVDFVALAQDATHSDKQFYTLLRIYQEKKDYTAVPYLAAAAVKIKENALVASIIADYEDNYLCKLSETEFATKGNLEFIGTLRTNLTSRDKVFQRFYRHRNEVDAIVQKKGFFDGVITFIVYKEEINPQLESAHKANKEPDWSKMSRAISDKYGETYAAGNILKSQVRWYKAAKDWNNYTKYLVAKVEMDSAEIAPKTLLAAMVLNNDAWDLFQYSNNKEYLQKALAWSDVAAQAADKPASFLLDTKANLLYKLGKKEEALAIEAKASGLDPKNADIQATYRKMQEGQPTW